MNAAVRLIDAGVERLQRWSPRSRVRFAFVAGCVCVVGWPTTHILLLVTRPAELATWVGHLLLALSWGAVLYTSMDFIATTDVREEQEE